MYGKHIHICSYVGHDFVLLKQELVCCALTCSHACSIMCIDMLTRMQTSRKSIGFIICFKYINLCRWMYAYLYLFHYFHIHSKYLLDMFSFFRDIKTPPDFSIPVDDADRIFSASSLTSPLYHTAPAASASPKVATRMNAKRKR